MTATTEATMPPISHTYGRISTNGHQAKGTGLLRQQGRLDDTDESWPERVSKEQGWRLSEQRYTDKGRSGFHRKNLTPKAALTKILRLIDEGIILPRHVILMDKLDRLTRAEVKMAYDLFRRILSAGVWICTREPFRIYHDDPENDSGFMDIMEPLWIMYCNWLESKKKQDNTAAAWKWQRAQARDKKRPHQARPPWWLRKNTTGRDATHYEPHPTFWPIARRLYELRWQHIGPDMIARKLRDEGVPFPARSNASKRGWNGNFVYETLTRRTTTGALQLTELRDGKRQPAGNPIPDYYPALVTEAEYQRTQALMGADPRIRNRRRGRPSKKTNNLFRGLAYDAESRLPLSLLTQHGPKSTVGYRAYLGTPNSPNLHPHHIQYEVFEAHVLGALAMLRPQDVLETHLRTNEREHKLAELEKRDAALDLRVRQLQAFLADPERDPATILPALDTAAAELKALRKQRQLLQQQCQSSRAEALARAQTLIQYRQEVTDPTARRELDERIADAIPTVTERICVQAQHLSRCRAIFHVQIWLHSGQCRYLQLPPARLRPGDIAWQLDPAADGWDLRRGPYLPDPRNAAPVAQPA